MSPEDIGKLRIDQLDDLLEGFKINNEEQQKMIDGKSGGSAGKKTLEDQDALRFLLNNNGKL
jgi:hypothetical protein